MDASKSLLARRQSYNEHYIFKNIMKYYYCHFIIFHHCSLLFPYGITYTANQLISKMEAKLPYTLQG